MTILMVVPEYPPRVVGGGGPVYQTIAEYLAERGHDVTVVHGEFHAASGSARQARIRGVNVVTLPTIPCPAPMPWLLPAMPPRPLLWPLLVRTIAGRRWDVAHLHGVGFPLVDAAGWLLRRRRVPYVFTSHSVPKAPFEKGPLARFAIGTYLRTATGATLRGAAVVTAVSGAIATDPAFPLPPRTRIVNNGIGTGYAALVRTPSPVLRLCSAGRLTRVKGFDTAIEAVALLRNDGLDVRYDLWGDDGGDAAAFQRLAKGLGVSDVVRFRGSFTAPERAGVFGACDVLVVPSRAESFGLVALEGMALGVPVVASDRDGLREVLGTVPTLVPPEDARALATAVARLARDPEFRGQTVRAGLERAEAFRWETLLPRYEACLVEAAAKAPS